MIEVQNAIIEYTMLGFEDHGILTAFLHVNYGGASQGFGGYALEGDAASGFIKEVLKVVGVEKWEDLKGKYVRVKSTSRKIHEIGNIIEDKWFNPSEFFNNK